MLYVSEPLDNQLTDRLNQVLADYDLSPSIFPRPSVALQDVWEKGLTGVLTWKVNGGEMPAISVHYLKEKDEEPKPDKEIAFPGLPVSYGPLEIAALKRGKDKKY
ncbi:DUF6603 domain-containing protein, partial [Streptomyces sp. URMC 126]